MLKHPSPKNSLKFLTFIKVIKFHILLLSLFLSNVAHLKTLYDCLEMGFGAITVYLLHRFSKGEFFYLI